MSGRRLAGVLRIRTIQERRARGELANRRRVHRDAVTAEELTWQRLDTRAHAAQTDAVLEDAGYLSHVAQRALNAAGMLAAAAQHSTAVDAAGQVEIALGEWTVAARRVEALDRLSERIRAAELGEQQRLAANEIDDLVLARFAHELEATR